MLYLHRINTTRKIIILKEKDLGKYWHRVHDLGQPVRKEPDVKIEEWTKQFASMNKPTDSEIDCLNKKTIDFVEKNVRIVIVYQELEVDATLDELSPATKAWGGD